MLKHFILLLLLLASPFSLGAQSHSETKTGPEKTTRPLEQEHFRDFYSCQKRIQEIVNKLDCKIPPVLYFPGIKSDRNTEWGIQFYAARLGMTYDHLNAVVSLTQSEEGKKKLSHFFTGLKCAGLPGDPVERKNWKSYLPTCPEKAPKSPPWYKDSKSANATYHPGAFACYRLGAQRPKNCDARLTIWECMGGKWLAEIPETIAEILKENSPSQQCCYSKSGNIITSGAAAGTADMVFKTRYVEDIVQQAMDEMEQTPSAKGHYPKDGKASLEHYIMDARIITACFPSWPGKEGADVKTYHDLGWGPHQ